MFAHALALVLLTAPGPGLTVDDMLAMERVSEPALSPDGKTVAFTLRTTDVAANRGRTDLWLVDVGGKDARRLTTDKAGDYSPQWMPDGKALLFLSTRSGSSQVWHIAVGGGEARQVTDFPVDVNTLAIAPDGQRLVFSLDVYPDLATLAETAAKDKASEGQPRIYDELLFRHWDSWEDGKRAHVFVWDIGTGQPRDLTRGMKMDSPERPFGGGEGIAIAPDGKTVAFVGRNAGRDAAWSTNLDVWLVPMDGSAAPVALTAANKGADWLPVWSPDGRSLAILSQARAGYESDKARVVVWDVATKSSRVLTDAWDYSASELAWSLDGKRLYTSADNVGHHSIFELDAKTGKAKLLVHQGTNQGVLVGKGAIVYTHDDLKAPAELYTLKGKITRFNDQRLAAIGFSEHEQFSFKGAHGDTVYGFAVKPHGFVAGQRYPVVMLIHGGPQGSMGDHWHYRWHPMAFAGAGFAVVFIDFHGSTGYGQKFTDSIRGDWGGAPFEDLMLGLDFALAKYPWMDKDKQVAAGASYGGYMINWINGQTDRFEALVCHDGNLDERMAYLGTEEVWFPEWEHGVPWESAGFAKHNPIDHVAKWKTPTLVIHGALDFRVLEVQGMSTFTALQRRGIPSRFIHFPDENHWVLKPKNSQLWHREVLGWLKQWTK